MSLTSDWPDGFCRFSNPDWKHWADKYPQAYEIYSKATYYGGDPTIGGDVQLRPTPVDRPDWYNESGLPRWAGYGGLASKEEYYSFFVWKDDGSGAQRMGTYVSPTHGTQPYPPGPRMGPVQEAVSLPRALAPEEAEEARQAWEAMPAYRAAVVQQAAVPSSSRVRGGMVPGVEEASRATTPDPTQRPVSQSQSFLLLGAGVVVALIVVLGLR